MRIALSMAVLTATATVALAQVPAFEVASVRPNRSGERSSGTRPMATGQFTATNVTLKDLVLRAWNLHESQLLDAPDWIGTETYDILARSAAPPRGGVRDVWLMVRALLTERFQLRIRDEVRELPAYMLVVAPEDGRLGPRIRYPSLTRRRSGDPWRSPRRAIGPAVVIHASGSTGWEVDAESRSGQVSAAPDRGGLRRSASADMPAPSVDQRDAA